MIRNIMPIVYVSNMDKAVDFYTKTLELELQGRWGDHFASVGVGEASIGLHPVESEKSPRAGTPGSIQVSLGLTRPLDDVVALLKERGVVFRGPVVEDVGVRLAHFADPDGNELFLCETKGW